jgi:hypothetical protein
MSIVAMIFSFVDQQLRSNKMDAELTAAGSDRVRLVATVRIRIPKVTSGMIGVKHHVQK